MHLHFVFASLWLAPIDCCTMSCIQVYNHIVWPYTQTNTWISVHTSSHKDTFFFFTNMDLEVPSLRPICCFRFQSSSKSSSKVEEESEWLICINCKAELFSQTETEATNVFSHIENTTCSLIAGRRGGGENNEK